MKLEIKLNQEQFDLLVTALVQIAQNSVKMAEAWAPKEEPINMELLPETSLEKPEIPTIGRYDYCTDTYIFSKVFGKTPGRYRGYKTNLLHIAAKFCGVKLISRNGSWQVRREDADKVIEYMRKHRED